MAVVVSAPPYRGNHVLYWSQRLGIHPSPAIARELDRAAAADENLVASILAAAIVAVGPPAVSLRSQEARLEGHGDFGAGTLTDLDVQRVRRHLDSGSVVVLPGGHAHRQDGETLMLGPRAADVTAVVLAERLGAQACHFVIDRGGLDPSRVTIHPEALRLAIERGIRLETYSFRSQLEVADEPANRS
jgi:aspartate kinase